MCQTFTVMEEQEGYTLEALGWSPQLAGAWRAVKSRRGRLEPGRVLRSVRRHVWVGVEGEVLRARVPGRLSSPACPDEITRPVVGDWVAVLRRSRATMVEAVLPRSSKFSRKVPGKHTAEQVIAANIDTVFLISGLDADHNPRRIERYVALAIDSGAEPVVVLNKADLWDDDPEELQRCVEEAISCAPDVAVYAISALRGDGLEPLRAYLSPGATVALLGSSGVGKSTLVNAFVGGERMKVGAVRERDGRGAHTTTHRELIVIPGGGLLIDTPGLRELQLWIDRQSLDEAFPEIAELAMRCRFNDCAHDAEPDCAVLAALEAEQLDDERYLSYRKLRAEIEHIGLRQRERGQGESSRRVARLYRGSANTRPPRKG